MSGILDSFNWAMYVIAISAFMITVLSIRIKDVSHWRLLSHPNKWVQIVIRSLFVLACVVVLFAEYSSMEGISSFGIFVMSKIFAVLLFFITVLATMVSLMIIWLIGSVIALAIDWIKAPPASN